MEKLVGPRILVIRGLRVILDEDLARLYGVTTKALKQAVKRNPRRFPGEFVLTIEEKEFAILRSQSVTSSLGWVEKRSGGRWSQIVTASANRCIPRV